MIDPDGALEDWEEAKLYSHYGNNAVALEPGVVFTYDRNTLLRRRAWRSSPSSAPSSAAAGAAATA